MNELSKYEKKVFSQNGEDGIIEEIFNRIGVTNKYFVEFGVQNGKECNTRNLCQNYGWKGLQMDCNDYKSNNIKQEFINAENINKIFKKYKVPRKFDLLSIDIDYNYFWVWKSLKDYYPRVVIIEYNASISPKLSKVVKYNPQFNQKQKTDYFGASLLAMTKLANSKGYKLLGCDGNGVNAFYIQSKLIKNNFKIKSVEEAYRKPRYGRNKGGHPKSKKQMIHI